MDCASFLSSLILIMNFRTSSIRESQQKVHVSRLVPECVSSSKTQRLSRAPPANLRAPAPRRLRPPRTLTTTYTSTPPRASSATRSRANSPRSPILIMPNYFLPPAHSLNNIYLIDEFARSSDRRLRCTTTAYANLSGGRHTPRTCPQRPPDYTFVYSSGDEASLVSHSRTSTGDRAGH